MFGPNSRFSRTVFIEDGASGKQESERERDANQYANAANSLSTITTAGGMAQNRYLKPSGNAAIGGEGALGTPTATPALSGQSTRNEQYTHDQMIGFSSTVGSYASKVDNLLETGSKEDLTALLEEIKKYGSTLPTDTVVSEYLKTLTRLEEQLTNKISTMGTTTSSSVVVGDAKNEGGHVSYEQYLRNYGGDSMKNYLAAVKSANDDYYRSLMTYGMNAESLAGGGLTGAGVSSYGNDAAWAARQGAVSYAGAVKQAADTESAKNYFNYVQNFKAAQAAEVKDKNAQRTKYLSDLIASGETNEETIKMLLGTTGLFTSEEIESYGNQIASGATSVVSAADKAAAETLFASTVESLGLNAAKEAVAQKYNNPDVAQEIYDEQVKIVSTAIMDIVNQYDPAKTDQDVIAKLKAYQKQGYLTEDELNTHIDTIQEKNAEHYGTLFEQARDQYDADKVLAALGIEVAEGADEATIMAEATKAAREALMQAHDNGAITTEKAVDIMTGDFANEIEAVTSSEASKLWLQHVCDKLLVWEDYSGELGTDALYKNILQFVTEEITFGEPDNYSLPLSFGGKRFFIVDKNKVLNPSDDRKITYQHMTDYGTADITMEPNESQMLRTIYNVWMSKNNAADAYVDAASGI